MKKLKIYYPDGSEKVINPSEKFEGKFKDLAISQSNGHRVRWKVL